MNQNSMGGAIVLAIGIIVAAAIGAYAFVHVRAADNTLVVTGSATKDVTSDAAKWTVTVNRTSSQEGIPAAQTRVGNDTQTVIDFFRAANIAAEDIQVSPIFSDRDYSSDTNAPVTYTVHDDVTVQSKDPALIDELSKKISSLAQKGVLLSPQPPQYFVTTLPALRVALIGQAVQDAKARAMEIASSTKQQVGALKAASSGVVQVMAPNSVDVSDYGSYDTSTIDKQVMVTAKATFFLK